MDSHGNEFRRGVGLPRPCFYAKRSDGGRGKPTPLLSRAVMILICQMASNKVVQIGASYAVFPLEFKGYDLA